MRLISPKELAKKLGKHISTVYRKIERGEIPHQKVSVEVIRVPWDDAKGEVCSA